jgi:hypothetical protein
MATAAGARGRFLAVVIVTAISGGVVPCARASMVVPDAERVAKPKPRSTAVAFFPPYLLHDADRSSATRPGNRSNRHHTWMSPPPPPPPAAPPPPSLSAPPPPCDPAPEPTTLLEALLGAGLLGLYAWRNRRAH